MAKYIVARLLRMIPVIFVLSVFVFSLMHMLPGDPITTMLAEGSAASLEAVEAMREYMGLNDPLYVQYGRFIGRALQGDLGRSIQSNRPVLGMIVELFPHTLQLALAAGIFSALLGISLGIVAALKKNTIFDSGSMLFALLGVSAPVFWVALLMILFFSVKLRWFSVMDQTSLKALVLPAIALGWGTGAIIARLVRANLLEVLSLDFIRTARAKGLAERAVIVRHALRNALNAVITVLGLQFGALMGGAVITESVFARQGIGRYAVNAVLKKDFPSVQGTVLMIALAYMLVNLVVDIICVYMDPRIRYN